MGLVTPFVLLAMQELRKAGLSIHLITQSRLDFGEHGIIGKALFDTDVFTETDELGEAMVVTFAYLSHVTSAFFTLPYSWPTPRNRRTHQAIQILRKRIQTFIDERRGSSTERNDLLSILLQAKNEDGEPMSDEQLMAECLNLFGAGPFDFLGDPDAGDRMLREHENRLVVDLDGFTNRADHRGPNLQIMPGVPATHPLAL